MKIYAVEYTYDSSWEASVSGRNCFVTEKEARDFMQRICDWRDNVTALTLITYEKII